MKHRFVTIRALETGIAAAAVRTIDLNMLDPISEILIWHSTNMGNYVANTGHPMQNILSVEIIDGSDVLFSLEGTEMQALDIYHSGIYPRAGEYHLLSGLSVDMQIAINFGRYLWDEELALDPSKFLNPQLKITYAPTLLGQAPTTCELRVNAALFDEKEISPSGFLMTKEIKQWAATAASHQYTDLPIDYPYRKLFIQNRINSYDPRVTIGNIKLSSDQDKKVIINHNAWDILMGLGRENAYIEDVITFPAAAAIRDFNCTATAGVQGAACEFDTAGVAGDIGFIHAGGGFWQAFAEAAGNAQAILKGWAPHGALCIPFGKQGVIDDWFNVGSVGHLLLDVTDGSAHGQTKVYVQQYRTY